MDELSKVKMDAATDQAVMALRGVPLTAAQHDAVRVVAEALAVQFPDVPNLGRVLVAVAQSFAVAGIIAGGTAAAIVSMIGAAGVRLCDEDREPPR